MRDLEQGLNAEQRAAVTAPDGATLVIAAAGTGKTRTLTHRVAHLVQRGEPADRILLLTFTNRAAAEMLARAKDLAGAAVSGLWGGTFHHMANRLLRRHAPLLGYASDYTILDQDDARRLMRECIREVCSDVKSFPKPEVLLSLFGLAVGTEEPLPDIVARRYAGYAEFLESFQRIHKLYNRRKRALQGMDFDDLLANGLRLFREHPRELEQYQQWFRHILVDEYQDTNTIQAAWVDLLAAVRRRLFVVGDDFQCIYAWRGANYRNILEFKQRYPEALTFMLETNYRSTPNILEVANACIAGNPLQFQKTLRAARPAAQPPSVLRPADGREQAAWLTRLIQSSLAQGTPPSEIAVLYRAHFHVLELQLELQRAGVPFAITSGLRFFEQAHIKDIATGLRLVVNPLDELAFKRLLEMLPRVGERTAARIWERLGRRFLTNRPEDRDTLCAALPPAAREAGRALSGVFADYHEGRIASGPAALLDHFTATYYREILSTRHEDPERRMEDIKELIVYAMRHERCDTFLAETALQTNTDSGPARHADLPEDSIRLSTIHQAKGLEWKQVFILWCIEGLFPASRSLEEERGEEEERRLFYVAVTRARDALVLSAPGMRFTRNEGCYFCEPSRFIAELPTALLHQVASRGTYRHRHPAHAEDW